MDANLLDFMDARINAYVSKLFFDDVTLAHGAANGIPDALVLYGAGRAGAMGDVNAAAVVSAFGFFAPTLIEEVWPAVASFGSPSHIAGVFAEGMARSARASWDPAAAAVVARIGGTVVDAVVPLGTALFAGWQAMARPDDAPGAAALVAMALRELRGDVHIQCVAAEGLHPLEAEIVSRGAAGAELHGWAPPYPNPDAHRERVEAAQRATTARMARHYAILPDADLEALADAVRALLPR